MAGTLVGTIKDGAGNLIAGSKATVPGLVITNTTGFYRAVFASGGFYEITASAPGFKSVKQVRDLSSGAMNTVTFVLPPA